MTTLAKINTAGQQLETAAAASFKRMQTAYGKTIPVTSAWRSTASQQALYDGWKAGRPGYNYALPPAQSNHCKGTALDVGTAARSWLAKNAATYGWIQDRNEAWHYDYVPSKDTKRPGSSGSSSSSSVLTTGSTGTKVRTLQTGLRTTFPAYAKNVATDGVYGPKTAAAVKEFQRRTGLDPDGVVGAKTTAKLKTYGITL